MRPGIVPITSVVRFIRTPVRRCATFLRSADAIARRRHAATSGDPAGLS